MGVPVPSVLAAGGTLTGVLVFFFFAIVGFALVAGVAAVILALLHAVLPGEDAGAAALHAEELERQAAEPGDEAAEDPPELRSGDAVG